MDIVISLGGSVINGGKININLLKKSIDYIKKSKDRFFVVCGGGNIAREYTNAAKKIEKNKKSYDLIGIEATRLNAKFVELLAKASNVKAIYSDKLEIKKGYKLVSYGGYSPGHTTDYDTIVIAKKLKAKLIFNVTDVDFIYDKNPKKYKKAKPIKELSWDEYFKLIPKKHTPSEHLPFDYNAAKLAKVSKIDMYSFSWKNFIKYMEDKKVKGSFVYC
jgi:uridylate kinase